MTFQELINLRQSVKYRNQPVEQAKIEQIIEAVRLAPSACNSQPRKIIIVDGPELKNEVAKATFSKTMLLNKFADLTAIKSAVCRFLSFLFRF
jgi:nitroreductase